MLSRSSMEKNVNEKKFICAVVKTVIDYSQITLNMRFLHSKIVFLKREGLIFSITFYFHMVKLPWA